MQNHIITTTNKMQVSGVISLLISSCIDGDLHSLSWKVVLQVCTYFFTLTIAYTFFYQFKCVYKIRSGPNYWFINNNTEHVYAITPLLISTLHCTFSFLRSIGLSLLSIWFIHIITHVYKLYYGTFLVTVSNVTFAVSIMLLLN